MPIYRFGDMLVDPQKYPWGYGLWTPANIQTSLWLDAAIGVTLDSDNNVSEWSDKSGNNRHATQETAGRRPWHITKELNGKPVVRFNRDDNHAMIGSFIVSSQPTMLFIVGSNNSISSGGANESQRMWFRSGNQSIATYHDSPNDIFIWGGSAALQSGVFGVISHSILSACFDGNDSCIKINAVKEVAGNPGSGSTEDSYSIGHHAGVDARFLDGDIAEVLFFTTMPSSYDVLKIEGYLAHKWGLTGNLPSGHPYKDSAP